MGSTFSWWGVEKHRFHLSIHCGQRSQIERFSVIIVGTGGYLSNHRRKSFFYFPFAMIPLATGLHNRLCTTRSNNMAFAFWLRLMR